jgi:hypothetical protein
VEAASSAAGFLLVSGEHRGGRLCSGDAGMRHSAMAGRKQRGSRRHAPIDGPRVA